MDEAPDIPLPPGLKALQRLVTVLTVVMILGFLVLIATLVMRLNADGPPLPDSLDLPEGSEAVAFTQGGDWFAVVTADDRILVYDRLTGRLRQTVVLD
jgi:hypothetical protein